MDRFNNHKFWVSNNRFQWCNQSWINHRWCSQCKSNHHFLRFHKINQLQWWFHSNKWSNHSNNRELCNSNKLLKLHLFSKCNNSKWFRYQQQHQFQFQCKLRHHWSKIYLFNNKLRFQHQCKLQYQSLRQLLRQLQSLLPQLPQYQPLHQQQLPYQ